MQFGEKATLIFLGGMFVGAGLIGICVKDYFSGIISIVFGIIFCGASKDAR